MTDRAYFDYARFDYTKFDIYRPTFDKIVRKVEATRPRSFKEILRAMRGLTV